MAQRLVFVLLATLVGGVAMAQAYRWVDEDGVVHYSDRPHEGAEQIVLPKPNTITVPRRPAPARQTDARTEEPSAAEAFRYTSFEIASPQSEETLWNIEGVLNVSLDVAPGLQAGHQVRVYFDGEPQTVNGTSFQIQEVWRGEHNLQAEVLDETGAMLIRTPAIRFYVQQNTIIR
jgi:hypothetical protein